MVVSKAEFEKMKRELNESFAALVKRVEDLENAAKPAPKAKAS